MPKVMKSNGFYYEDHKECDVRSGNRAKAVPCIQKGKTARNSLGEKCD
jgi:hypothetical protein